MRWTSEDFAEVIGAFRRETAGAIRRMVVGVAQSGVWQMLGHLLFDPTQREQKQVENYPGIGHYAKPPAGTGNAEGIVVQVGGGGANNPALVATRDEGTRAAAFSGGADLVDNESALYNSLGRVYVKSDGTIEIRTHAGVAIKLPTMADFLGLIAILNASGVGAATNVPGAVTTYQAANPTWPVGTTTFKAQ